MDLSPVETPVVETMADPSVAFKSSLQELANHLPEVAEQQSEIEIAGGQIIEELGLKPELFEDQANSLFFGGLAQRYADLEKRKPELSVDQYVTEKEFIFDATSLLAGDKSALYPELQNLIDVDSNANEATVGAVYGRFTNEPVSRELREAMDSGGLLDEVKERLKITPETEDHFTVQVLNVADDYSLHGLRRSIPNMEGKHWEGPEWKDWSAEDVAYKDYAKGLKENGIEFRRQLGMEAGIPIAWVRHVNGETTLNIPLPVAEKILYTGEERASHYSERDAQNDKAILEHEYTHTQGGLNIGKDVFYGIGPEELRAEHFSGNKQGYQNIKAFYADLKIVTGLDVPAYFDAHPKGGDQAEFYTMMAQELGLQNTVEVALTVPSQYIEPSARPLQAHTAHFLGSGDAVIQRMYNQQLGDPSKVAAMESRIDAASQRLAQVPSFDSWVSYRKGALGMEFVTSKLEERVAEIRGKAAADQGVQ